MTDPFEIARQMAESNTAMGEIARSVASRTARNDRNLKASADAAKATARSVNQMIRLTEKHIELSDAQVRLSLATREDAARTERFTRLMAWISLAVAVGSLAVAVVAIFT